MVLMVLRLYYNVWILKAFYIFRLLEALPRLYCGGVYPPPGVSLWAFAASRTQPNQSKEHTNKPQTEKPGSDQRQAAEHDTQPKDIENNQHRPQWETLPQHTHQQNTPTHPAASGGRVARWETHPRHIKAACAPCVGMCWEINRKSTRYRKKQHKPLQHITRRYTKGIFDRLSKNPCKSTVFPIWYTTKEQTTRHYKKYRW